MMYQTHKAGGALAMLTVFGMMQSKGLLLQDVSPLMQLAIMYPMASMGSTIPDL